MNTRKVLMAAALLHSALLFSQATDTAGAVKEITPQQLAGILHKGVAVIDVNEDYNYAEAHVPGAIRMDYDAIAPDRLPVKKSTTVVFYCWSAECPAAEQAAQSASMLGYSDARCMKAGITGWQDAGLPTEP